MNFAIFLLLNETKLPQLKTSIVDRSLSSRIKLDSGREFEADIWQTTNGENGEEQASIQFYQIINAEVLTARNDEQSPIDTFEFIQLFLGIEELILEYFKNNPSIQVIKIHPEAVGTRNDIINKRNRTNTDLIRSGRWIMDNDRRSPGYDVNKGNAYMQLFNYSKLKQMGYTIRSSGEFIFIEKPQN